MPPTTHVIECTAYCRCGHCCKWEWGVKLPGSFYLGLVPHPIFLRFRRRRKAVVNTPIPLIARYWTTASPTLLGGHYEGITSSGTFPSQPRPGILSEQSLRREPRKIPGRLLLFPWRLLAKQGTIAADTAHFPFGTKMFVPGYGWGMVEDRGSAIKGPRRVDLFHHSHRDALQWGRRTVPVLVVLPGQSTVDFLRAPGPLRPLLKAAVWVKRLFF